MDLVTRWTNDACASEGWKNGSSFSNSLRFDELTNFKLYFPGKCVPVRMCLGAMEELKPCINPRYLIFLACLVFQSILFSVIPSPAAQAGRCDHHLGAWTCIVLHASICRDSRKGSQVVVLLKVTLEFDCLQTVQQSNWFSSGGKTLGILEQKHPSVCICKDGS